VTRVAWPGGAATRSWSFLTKILAGGLFWHFTRRGGLIRQKFVKWLAWAVHLGSTADQTISFSFHL
jgi:hypothetical protein